MIVGQNQLREFFYADYLWKEKSRWVCIFSKEGCFIFYIFSFGKFLGNINFIESITVLPCIHNDPVFPDAPFLLRFLRAKKFSVPMAQEALERYILLRTTYGDLAFSKLDPKNPTMQELLNLG